MRETRKESERRDKMSELNLDFLNSEQRACVLLKKLYLSYGYEYFRLPGFEEYSLYAENKSFLPEGDAITFTAGGKLLALRPDVTMSVVKNMRAAQGTKKVFYDENVYRRGRDGSVGEVAQMGVEVIGDVDGAVECECIELALGTLATISDKYLLDLSHAGIVKKVEEFAQLSPKDGEEYRQYLSRKNRHDFERFLTRAGVDGKGAEMLRSLIVLPPKQEDAFSELYKMAKCVDIGREIEELKEMAQGRERIELNFSVVGDRDYYSGAMFKGYIEGAPAAALSGGRYDGLAQKLGLKAGAIGFALYLGEIPRYAGDKPKSADVAVIYNEDNGKRALKIAARLRSEGKNVLMTKCAPAFFAGEIVAAEEKDD